jgi:hypothetical protein
MLSRQMFLRTAEDRAAYKRRLRVMFACYGVISLAGFGVFALKPASTSAHVTNQIPAVAAPANLMPPN